LAFIRGKMSDRKLRLFACACARQAWHLLPEESSRAVIQVSERFADGRASVSEMKEAGREAKRSAESAWVLWDEGIPEAAESALATSYADLDLATREAGRYSAAAALSATQGTEVWKGRLRQQCHLLRDLMDDPFQPCVFASGWATPLGLSLAKSIYDAHDPESGHLHNAHLAVLADALEEAGCTYAALLNHLRSQELHVRGCFAVDLVLNKEPVASRTSLMIAPPIHFHS
jgi:hypothetical protein